MQSLGRPFPEALPAGPACGQFIPELSPGGENHEVLQLHAGQQPAAPPDVHARDVVSRGPGRPRCPGCVQAPEGACEHCSQEGLLLLKSTRCFAD